MRGDLPQAALNLLASLPVRVHKAPEPPSQGELARRRALGVGSGGHNRMAVRVHGIEFKSIALAKKGLHLSTKTIQALLRTGEAQYIKESA